eukprot:2637611-Pleurochrysis_carterae.AAC.4
MVHVVCPCICSCICFVPIPAIHSLHTWPRWWIIRLVLANAMATKQFGAALDAALQLRQPRALRKVVEALEETQAGDAKLRAAVGALDEEGLLHCLQCARTWNTTAAHSLTAHRMLHAVLRSRSAEAVAALPAAKELLEALLPYSQRHFERLDRLLLSSHFVTYTLTAMRMLLPPGDAAAAADGAAEQLHTHHRTRAV